jgi:hypothetical protein
MLSYMRTAYLGRAQCTGGRLLRVRLTERSANGRNRRIFLIVAQSGEGLLSQPAAGVQLLR